jgi:hypothetical protein
MDKDISVRFKEKNYHTECLQLVKERDRLGEYICYLFKLKKPGPRNYTLIKKYIEDNGYTYKGIFYSLKYFYEIKKNDIRKSNESIGIVPYVYDEAQKYFEDLENRKEKIKQVGVQVETTDKMNVTISTRQNKSKGRKEYDLSTLLGD